MDEGFIFSSSISIWDMDKHETVRIGIRTCRDPLVIPIDGPYKVENCIVVLIEAMNDDYE
jgi:hypothetical protein